MWWGNRGANRWAHLLKLTESKWQRLAGKSVFLSILLSISQIKKARHKKTMWPVFINLISNQTDSTQVCLSPVWRLTNWQRLGPGGPPTKGIQRGSVYRLPTARHVRGALLVQPAPDPAACLLHGHLQEPSKDHLPWPTPKAPPRNPQNRGLEKRCAVLSHQTLGMVCC